MSWLAAMAGATLAALVLAEGMPSLGTAHASAEAVRVGHAQESSVTMDRGKARLVQTSSPFDELVIGNPDVISVTPLSDTTFYVTGNEVGTSSVVAFDGGRQMVASVDVRVTPDTGQLSGAIRQVVPGSNIRVSPANGSVVLSGKVKDSVAADRARAVAGKFAGDDSVIDNLEITSSQQVQMNVRFVEINRDVGRELGTKMAAVYNGPGGSIGFGSVPETGSRSPAAVLIGSLMDGGASIDVAIEALEQRGVARRLAEPNLVARSGETANFLAGGEFPIPVSAENDRVTVEYKKFGVGLEFTPKVLSDGLISLDIEPEVSSIDHTASYRIGDIAIPGFSVRRAKTSVDLRSGQSFMVAGLLQRESNLMTERVPGLGRLPILGALFSSKAYQKRETDLVIIITPHLVKPMAPTMRPAVPTDGTRVATDVEFFLGNVEQASVGGASAGGHFLELR